MLLNNLVVINSLWVTMSITVVAMMIRTSKRIKSHADHGELVFFELNPNLLQHGAFADSDRRSAIFSGVIWDFFIMMPSSLSCTAT
jgi:hypothetical protein